MGMHPSKAQIWQFYEKVSKTVLAVCTNPDGLFLFDVTRLCSLDAYRANGHEFDLAH